MSQRRSNHYPVVVAGLHSAKHNRQSTISPAENRAKALFFFT